MNLMDEDDGVDYEAELRDCIILSPGIPGGSGTPDLEMSTAENSSFDARVLMLLGKQQEEMDDVPGALKWYERAADISKYRGEACRRIGQLLWNKDGLAAAKWLLEGAKAGDAQAQTLLGDCYRDGRGIGSSIEEAISWYSKAMEQGNQQAIFTLASLYYGGADGQVPVDILLAMSLFLRVEPGHAFISGMAAYYYAMGLLNNDGSIDEAVFWLQKSVIEGCDAAQGELFHLYRLGKLSTEATDHLLNWYQVEAAVGDTEARLFYAKLLLQGPRNPTDALRTRAKNILLQLIKDTGNSEAYYLLGEYGNFDADTTLKYFVAAAEASYTPACLKAGMMLLLRDEVGEACKYFLKGSSAGHSECCHQGGILMKTKDPNMAVCLFREGAAQNHLGCIYELARCNEEGVGMALDLEMALNLYEQAAKRGHSESKRKLKSFFLRLDPDLELMSVDSGHTAPQA